MTNAQFRYWEDGGHILISSDNWDCFLHNTSLNPMINWLNLHRSDIESGTPCKGSDKTDDVIYLSTNGFLSIRTTRDFVLLNKEQLLEFIAWLNAHREILNICEAWP